MNNVRVFHFDDNSRVITNVDTYITAINEDYQEQNISLKIQLESFKNTDSLIEKLKNKDMPQIIILDMYEEGNKNVGEAVLNTIKELRLNIPTIIFTQGSIDGYSIAYDKILKENPFIYGSQIIKSPTGDELKNRIKEIIENNHLQNDSLLFTMDEDDILLKAEIRSIGEQNVRQILHKIKNHFNYNEKFTIKRMSSGFSGAAVFKLQYGDKTQIFKISNDKQTLKTEHERSQNSYKEFPSIFRTEINRYNFETEKSYAILIEEVHTANPLFNWLKNNESQSDIESYFEKLYNKTNGLAYFYANKSNCDKSNKVKFTQIFDIFKNNYAFVVTSIKELKPIIEKYNSDFNDSNLKTLVLNGIYDKIDKDRLTEDNYQKYKILCHGDFHSNNIMCQGSANDPIIIDTGGIKYDYWCMDICRLIVHLFIVGYNKGTLKYFDISEIPNNLTIANKIITLEEISTDGINDGYVYAINWLTKNAPDIYGSSYCKWEFQLGLCKEFLQMSYRVNSVPANKRTIALLSAYECMLQANENIPNHS
jgi:hypothetical protein